MSIISPLSANRLDLGPSPLSKRHLPEFTGSFLNIPIKTDTDTVFSHQAKAEAYARQEATHPPNEWEPPKTPAFMSIPDNANGTTLEVLKRLLQHIKDRFPGATGNIRTYQSRDGKPMARMDTSHRLEESPEGIIDMQYIDRGLAGALTNHGIPFRYLGNYLEDSGS
ncbi:MAG: hypothetical protein K2X01_06540 [Cyanobacteria bacterium]|nr:hypothetical protein [Cyanobacteriota bacterium]